jgi:hypothetical protein
LIDPGTPHTCTRGPDFEGNGHEPTQFRPRRVRIEEEANAPGGVSGRGYGLADEALEGALYDNQALRDFVVIDLSRESVPDATTLLKFRRLLLDNDLTKALFEEINAHLVKPMALRNEGAHRCGRAVGPRTYGGGHRSQRE